MLYFNQPIGAKMKITVEIALTTAAVIVLDDIGKSIHLYFLPCRGLDCPNNLSKQFISSSSVISQHQASSRNPYSTSLVDAMFFPSSAPDMTVGDLLALVELETDVLVHSLSSEVWSFTMYRPFYNLATRWQ